MKQAVFKCKTTWAVRKPSSRYNFYYLTTLRRTHLQTRKQKTKLSLERSTFNADQFPEYDRYSICVDAYRRTWRPSTVLHSVPGKYLMDIMFECICCLIRKVNTHNYCELFHNTTQLPLTLNIFNGIMEW